MPEPTRTAIGTWSGGRFMHFGQELDDQRLAKLLAPGEGIDTVLTADTYIIAVPEIAWKLFELQPR